MNGAWCSTIVPMVKKVGSMRFCVDYHKVNKVSHFDALMYNMFKLQYISVQPYSSEKRQNNSAWIIWVQGQNLEGMHCIRWKYCVPSFITGVTF